MEKIPKMFNEELYDKYRSISSSLTNVEDIDLMMEVQSKKGQFGSLLRQKYGNEEIGRYALFHALGGSTITPEMLVDKDDLDGDDSIALFLDKLHEEYKDRLSKE